MNKKILLLCGLSGMIVASDRHQELQEKIVSGCYMQIGSKQIFEDRCHIGQNFFCIGDGHSGSSVATDVINKFPGILDKCIEKFSVTKDAFMCAVAEVEEDLFSVAEKYNHAGSTLVAVYVGKETIHITWVGDSRAVCGSKNKIVAATRDHTLEDKDELDRVRKNKGIITRLVQSEKGNIIEKGPLRANGLIPTRTLGDFPAKGKNRKLPTVLKGPGEKDGFLFFSQILNCNGSIENMEQPKNIFPQDNQIIAVPDYIEVERKEDVPFIVIASDGLWDVMSNESAIAYVEELANEGKSMKEIAAVLVQKAVELESYDDITAIILDLR